MRVLFLLIVVLNCGNAFTQKHRKSKNVFTYSYRLDAAQYTRQLKYGFQLTEYNQDSVLVTCMPDSANVSGTISYSYDLISGITYSADGKFQIKVAKSELNTTILNLTIQFEGYDETIVHAELAGYPDEFFVFIPRHSIFDKETPYIIVNSVYPMTSLELQRLVDCLSENYGSTSCYDEKSVKLVIPI